MRNPADQEALRQVADAVRKAFSDITPVMKRLGQQLRDATIQVKSSLEEFGKEVNAAMETWADGDEDDGKVGAEK